MSDWESSRRARGKHREWRIDGFLSPQPPLDLHQTNTSKALTTNTSLLSGTHGRAFWGTTRKTQFESDRRAELRVHQSKRSPPTVIDHLVPSLGVQKQSAMDIDTLWQAGVPSHPSVVENAKLQMSGSAGGATTRLVMDAPKFHNEVHPGALREVPVLEGSGAHLVSASERRREHQLAVGEDRARTELAAARRSHQRLNFISKNRHPCGVLMCESMTSPESTLYGGVRETAQKEATLLKDNGVRRKRFIEDAMNKSVQSGTLLHHAPLDPATPFIQRRNHQMRMPDTFKIATMQNEVTPKYSPERQNLLRYTATRERTRDIITGIPLATVVDNPYR